MLLWTSCAMAALAGANENGGDSLAAIGETVVAMHEGV